MRFVLVVFLAAVSLTTQTGNVFADGLILSIPANGNWASFIVHTEITHEDGETTETNGVLTVKALGSETVNGRRCRWLEFELSWGPEAGDLYHGSVWKLLIEEDVLSSDTNPLSAIRKGYRDKVSNSKPQNTWKYKPKLMNAKENPMEVEEELSHGVINFYLTNTGSSPKLMGSHKFEENGHNIDTQLRQWSHSDHPYGENVERIRSTAYNQWRSSKAPFGVAKYEFDVVTFNGLRFTQSLSLKETGVDAVSAIPDAN